MLFFPVLVLSGHQFSFQDGNTLSFIEETTTEQSIYRNGTLDKTVHLKTVLTAEQKSRTSDSTSYQGTIRYLLGNSKKQFKEKAARTVIFSRTTTGKTEQTGGTAFMPRQNFPSFNLGDVALSGTWTASVTENFNLLPLGVRDSFSIPAGVTYRYVRDQELDGHDVAVVLYHYEIKSSTAPGPVTSAVQGSVVGVLFWNKAAQQPQQIQETYDFTFTFKDNESIRTHGMLQRSILTITEKAKRQLSFRKDLNTTLGDNQDIRITKDGVVLNLGSILFEPGKTVLKLDAMKTLIRVAEFLKKKGNVRAMIEGHTDNEGLPSFNNQLSRDRALRVYKFFVEQADIPGRRLNHRGWGPDKPIADNGTEDGRARNRRVEIIFLVE